MVGRRNRAGHPGCEAVLHSGIPPRRARPGARHASGDTAMIGWFKALDMGSKTMVIVFLLLVAVAVVGIGIHLVDTAFNTAEQKGAIVDRKSTRLTSSH